MITRNTCGQFLQTTITVIYIQFDKARSTTALFSVRRTEVFLRLQYYQNGPLTFSSKSFSNRLSIKRFRRLDSIMEPELNSRSTGALLGIALCYIIPLTYNCLMCGCLLTLLYPYLSNNQHLRTRDDSILNKSRNPVANLFNAHNGYVTKVLKFSQYL